MGDGAVKRRCEKLEMSDGQSYNAASSESAYSLRGWTTGQGVDINSGVGPD